LVVPELQQLIIAFEQVVNFVGFQPEFRLVEELGKLQQLLEVIRIKLKFQQVEPIQRVFWLQLVVVQLKQVFGIQLLFALLRGSLVLR